MYAHVHDTERETDASTFLPHLPINTRVHPRICKNAAPCPVPRAPHDAVPDLIMQAGVLLNYFCDLYIHSLTHISPSSTHWLCTLHLLGRMS
jgi:hypothetical protein